MSKAKNITYWVSTLWLALGMTSTGIVQIIHKPSEVNFINELGYPAYLLTIIAVWKFLGVITVLIPRFTILKEWAYAGFFFCMTGAIWSHIEMHHGIKEIFPPMLLLTLTIVSWSTRPDARKIAFTLN